MRNNTTHIARHRGAVVAAILLLGIGAAGAISSTGTNPAHPPTQAPQATTAWLANEARVMIVR